MHSAPLTAIFDQTAQQFTDWFIFDMSKGFDLDNLILNVLPSIFEKMLKNERIGNFLSNKCQHDFQEDDPGS